MQGSKLKAISHVAVSYDVTTSTCLLPVVFQGKTPAINRLFENKIITVRDAADFLGVSTKTIYKLVAREQIPYKKVGSKIRFLLPVLMDWAKG